LRRRTAPLSRLGLLAIIFVVFAAQGRLLLADPLLIPRVCAAAALFLVGTIACGHLLMRLLGRRRDESVPFIYTTTSRNNAIALAVATLAFGGETQLVIAITGAMTQFPVVLAYTLWRGRREGVL
jgi:ACR3 family arsenite efflux pump ArsB